MKSWKTLLLLLSIPFLAWAATESALYLHHERSTLADLEADLQNREIGLNPEGQNVVGKFSDGSTVHLISQEQPAVDLTGTFSVTGAASFSNNITASILNANRLIATNGTSQLTVNPVLTANGFLYPTGSGALASTAAAGNGQILIGSTSAAPVLGSITGTTNRISVSLGAGTIGLSTPQDMHTAASPTFAGLTLSGLTASRLMASNGSSAAASVSDLTSWIAGTANQITSTSDGDGTLTLSLPQNIHTGASPTFTGLNLSANLTTTAAVVLNSATPSNRTIGWQTAGSDRWGLTVGSTAESGSNAGSNLLLRAFTDAGAVIDTPFTISRVSGGTYAIRRPVTTSSTLEVVGPIKSGTGTRTFATKNFTAIGASFDGTSVQFENTDVGTVAQGRAYNFGITDVSGTEGRFDLTQPGERTVWSIFSNGNMGIGSTTDGGERLQVTGTARVTGLLTASSGISITGGTSGAGKIWQGASNGLNLQGIAGSTNDFALNSASGSIILRNPTGTTGLSFPTAPTFESVTASQFLLVDGSKALTSVAGTGSGSVVRQTGASLIAPALGNATATSIEFGSGDNFSYDQHFFTATGTGFGSTVNGTAYYVRLGYAVTLHLPNLTGTSNSTSYTITGVPVGIRPTRAQTFPIPGRLIDNGNRVGAGLTPQLTMETDGTITFSYTTDGSSGETFGTWFTASGDKGLATATITYLLQ